MKLTIIETGHVPASISADWPSYPAMFEALLAPHMPGLTVETVELYSGATLPAPANLEAILITGAAAGVYDDTPWMQPLFEFIRAAATAGMPQIGICFGHQAIAKALGAEVTKSDKGWGIGRHDYQIRARPDWLGDSAATRFALGVSHQDQVLSLPPGALTVAGSDFCPYAAIDYPSATAISFQGHPEYSPEFACALYAIRKGTILASDKVDAAGDSFSQPLDNNLVGKWMARFLSSHTS